MTTKYIIPAQPARRADDVLKICFRFFRYIYPCGMLGQCDRLGSIRQIIFGFDAVEVLEEPATRGVHPLTFVLCAEQRCHLPGYGSGESAPRVGVDQIVNGPLPCQNKAVSVP